MAESAAAAVVTSAAPATPAVGTAQPMVATKVAGETFAQQMERFGGFTAPDGAPLAPDAAPSAAAPDAADAKIARAKGKKGGKGKATPAAAAPAVAAAVEAAPAAAQAAAAPAVDKLAQLQALAAELDLQVEAGVVTARERVAFREQKRDLARRIEQQEHEVLRRLNDVKTQFSGRLERAEKLEQAAANGDYEGIAQILGKKDWNALQEEVIARISDPNYKRLKELEQFKAEQEQRAQAAQRENEYRTMAARREAAMRDHVTALSAQMAKSQDPLVAAMHDDPTFIRTVIEVQRQNWDGQSTVSPEKAIRIAAQGFQAPLQQTMRGLYDRLHKVFGVTPAQAAAAVAAVGPAAAQAAVVAATPAAPAKGKANKTAVVPVNGSDAASAPKTNMTRKERDAEFTRRLSAAIAEDNGNG